MKTVLLLLAIAAAMLTVITFGGWVTLWRWDSPLWYSAILVGAAVSLYPQKRVGYFIAGVASLIVSTHFILDMFAEGREYLSSGASLGEALWFAFTPIDGPVHLAVALIVFAVAAASLAGRGLKLQ
jgi:hypothetical protein